MYIFTYILQICICICRYIHIVTYMYILRKHHCIQISNNRSIYMNIYKKYVFLFVSVSWACYRYPTSCSRSTVRSTSWSTTWPPAPGIHFYNRLLFKGSVSQNDRARLFSNNFSCIKRILQFLLQLLAGS